MREATCADWDRSTDSKALLPGRLRLWALRGAADLWCALGDIPEDGIPEDDGRFGVGLSCPRCLCARGVAEWPQKCGPIGG